MEGLAVQMRQEGVFHRVFYDGNVKSSSDFVAYLKRPANVPVFLFCGLEPLGFAWLNSFSGSQAFAHFCGLKAARGQAEMLGMFTLNYWLSTFDFLDLILGLTPGNNRLAVRFIKQIGFTVLGEIPRAVYDAYAGERVAGVVSYYAR